MTIGERTSRVALATILLCICCLRGTSPPAAAGDRKSAGVDLAGISLPDGISRSEAEIIASYFFYYYANVGCGGVDAVRESRDGWRVGTRLGVAGEPGDDIVIDKSDGSVLWRNCRVANPMSMLESTGDPTQCAGNSK